MGADQSTAARDDAPAETTTSHDRLAARALCRVNPTYYAPLRLHKRERASANQPEADLSALVLKSDYEATELPTATAAVALVAHAYDVVVSTAAIEARLEQPASLDDVVEYLGMQVFPVHPTAPYVRYYLNQGTPVCACVALPPAWLADESGASRSLDRSAGDGRDDDVLVACVVFKHTVRDGLGIAFDLAGETRVRFVSADAFNARALEARLIDTSTMRAAPTNAPTARPRRRTRIVSSLNKNIQKS